MFSRQMWLIIRTQIWYWLEVFDTLNVAKKFVRLEDQRVRGADGSKHQHQSQDRGTYKRQYKARHRLNKLLSKTVAFYRTRAEADC